MNIVLVVFLVKTLLTLAPTALTCDVVPIHVWGDTPSRRVEDLPKPVELVVVTHTVTTECDTDVECQRVGMSIRKSMIEQGSMDIGLSFLVGGNGKIYEGAGWKVGSHTRGYNQKSISLSFIGNFEEKLPTRKALEAVKNFLGCSLNSRDLGYEYSLVGHRQLKSTISPGYALQREIETWPHWTSDASSLLTF